MHMYMYAIYIYIGSMGSCLKRLGPSLIGGFRAQPGHPEAHT